MIDSHCHLADKAFAEDLDEVLLRAKQAGVSPLITIADSIPESEKCVTLARAHENLFCVIGVHPHHAKSWNDASEEKLLTLMQQSDRVKAIGEIGLDYHYDFSPRDTQKRAFEAQLELAKHENVPVVIHCREAVAEVRDLLLAHRPTKAVVHCCTETFDDVAPLIDAGYFLSFTGIATYTKSDVIRDTIRQCPIDQLMIETDSPYLAPVPHRGKRNEPAFIIEVARCVADVKGLSLEEIDKITTKNTMEFFGL